MFCKSVNGKAQFGDIRVDCLVFALILVISAVGVSEARYSGGAGEPNDPYRIGTPNDLNDIGNHPDDFDAHFVMVANIDLSGYSFAPAVIAPDISTSSDFQGTPFTGVFDGNGHTISNLIINTADDSDTSNDDSGYLGLFGYIGAGGEVKNLGIEDVNVSGGGGSRYLGGLSGLNDGMITYCYTTGAVSGTYASGGLCGSNSGTIMSCYATGTVSVGPDCILCDSGPFGGLCGRNYGGTISTCYAMSEVSGGDYSYRIGGLCGRNYEGTIINCYATGVVSGTDGLGGLCGSNSGTISSCFWDVETSGQTTSHGGLGLQTIQMQQMTYFGFNGWENSDWRINDGNDYPRLVWENSGGEVIVVPEVNLAGEGTEEDPWQIADVNDLLLITMGTYFWDKHFILTSDIDLAGVLINRIGYDKGTFLRAVLTVEVLLSQISHWIGQTAIMWVFLEVSALGAR